MAAVLGIIRSHHGSINIKSTPRKGTTIRVYFPASSKKLTDTKHQHEYDHTPAGNNVVLMVDDDDTIRDIVKQALSIAGYSVLNAADGQEGVDVFMAHVNEIDLVILDMTMPKLNGLEVYELIHMENPEIKTIISSGYSVDELAVPISKNKNIHFLQKPFTVTELLELISRILQN